MLPEDVPTVAAAVECFHDVAANSIVNGTATKSTQQNHSISHLKEKLTACTLKNQQHTTIKEKPKKLSKFKTNEIKNEICVLLVGCHGYGPIREDGI